MCLSMCLGDYSRNRLAVKPHASTLSYAPSYVFPNQTKGARSYPSPTKIQTA